MLFSECLIHDKILFSNADDLILMKTVHNIKKVQKKKPKLFMPKIKNGCLERTILTYINKLIMYSKNDM